MLCLRSILGELSAHVLRLKRPVCRSENRTPPSAFGVLALSETGLRFAIHGRLRSEELHGTLRSLQ